MNPTSLEKAIQSVYQGQRYNSLADLGYDVRCFFLCPNDRMQHTAVIDERCEDMIVQGLLKETADLRLNDRLPDGSQAARAIGYRQTLDYLMRKNPKENDIDAFSDYLNKFTTATRQYAKKQMQWFRKDGAFVFVPVDMKQSKAERIDSVTSSVIQLCRAPRSVYESELSDDNSVSTRTITNNAAQAKGMKFYHPRRYKLVEDSDLLKEAVVSADINTQRLQGLVKLLHS